MTPNAIARGKNSFFYRFFCSFLAFIFACNFIIPPNLSFAQTVFNLPIPGSMVTMSPGFAPAVIKGLTIYPNNPLEFDFIVDTGESGIKIESPEFRTESRKLIKYFLAALTVPDEELWVNLSPYEGDRIIAAGFGQTEMGRDLLAQDYLLKQLMASLTYPEDSLGKKFWDKVNTKARQVYGTTNIPMNTFNKVWIVPEQASIYEIGNSAIVVKSRLKVMLEGDYIALKENKDNKKLGMDKLNTNDQKQLSDVSTAIVKEIIIPEIEKEVNEGQTFANLRQIYHSMILATWYKKALKESLLGQIYVDRNKIKGVDTNDKKAKEKIYNQYLEAFRKGVYNYIREDVDPASEQKIPRKYFSGGYQHDSAKVTVDARGETIDDFSPQEVRTVQQGMQTQGQYGAPHVVLAENVRDPQSVEALAEEKIIAEQQSHGDGSVIDNASLAEISETFNQLSGLPNDAARQTFLTEVTHLSQVAPLFSLGHLTRKDIEGKVVVARFAFEVQLDRTHPIYSARRVKDDARLRNVIDTIRFIVENGGRLVIIPGYNGRPPGRVVNNELSMAPVALRLTEILREQGIFTPDESIQMFTDHLVPSIDANYVPQNSFDHLAELKTAAAQMPAGRILMTESTRFTPLEDQANEPLAREIAALGDIFVSDPPAQDHRRNASNLAAQYAPVAVLGFSILKEVDLFADIRRELLKTNRKSFVFILAGSKVDTEVGVVSKISVTEMLLADLQSIDSVLVGGALAYPFIIVETWQDIKERLAAADVWQRIEEIRLKPVENFEDQLSAETKRIIAEEVRETDQKNAKTQAWLLQEIFDRRFEDIKDLMGESYISWNDIFDQLLIVQRIFNFIERRRAQGVNFTFETNMDHVIGDKRFVNGQVPDDTGVEPYPHRIGIPRGWAAGDIGPQTIARWTPIVASAGTVVIAGPLGIAESKKFQDGSFKIATAATQADQSIGAGGDTRAMLEDAKLVEKFTHASVAGGSSLEKIDGTKITPGVKAVFEQENALTFLSNIVAPRVVEQSQSSSPGTDNASLTPENPESSDLQVTYSWLERDSRSGQLVPNGHTYQLSVIANAKETVIIYAGKEGTKEIRLPGRNVMLDKINQGQERRRGWDAYDITNELHLRMNAEGIEPQVIDSRMTKVDNLPGRDWFTLGKEKLVGRISFGEGLERLEAFQAQSRNDNASPTSQKDNAFLAELTPSLVQAGGQETPRLDVELLDGARGHFVVPAGTSTSSKEDKTTEPAIALANIRRIHERATQRELRPDQLVELGQLMWEMDQEAIRSGGQILGAQAKLAYQMSRAWAVARSRGLEFYQFLRELAPGLAPQTGYLESEMEYNLTNGGAHVAKRGFSRNEIDAQEFMVQPKAANLRESNQMADRIDRQLGEIYRALGLQADPNDQGIYVEDPTKISLRGREGGYSIPDLTRAKLAEIYQNVDIYADKGILRHLNLRQLAAEKVGIHEFIINTQMAAIQNAGYVADKTRRIGTVALTLDVAASEFYENGFYLWEGERLTSQQLVAKLAALAKKYPILSIEDGMSEFDIEGWMDLIEAIGDEVWLIGDDVFATQGKLLWDFVQKMKERGWVDAQGKVTKKIRILIKLNQNGFLTTGIHDPEAGYLGTIEVMELAERLGVKSTVSHRSREPGEDQNEVSIAHVAAAFGADLKSGDHLQPARAVKEDELARIDDLESQPAQWTGPSWTMEYHPETGITQTFTSAPDARSLSPIAEERGNTIPSHQISYWRDLAATHEHATLADHLKTIKNQKVIPLAVRRAVEQSPNLTGVKDTGSRSLVDNAALVEEPVLHEDIEKTANLLGVEKKVVEFALTHLADKKKILVYLAEAVAISQQKTLENMIEAGMARRLSATGLEYELLGNAFDPEVLWKFIRLQVASSSNAELIDLTEMPVRVERILLSAVDLDDFVQILTPREVQDTANLLREHGLFPTLTESWQSQHTRAAADPNQVPLRVEDTVSPGATGFYSEQGIDVEFNLPEGTMVGQSHLQVVQKEMDTYRQDMARGGYPYRGVGTHQTVLDFFKDYFQPRWYERIRNYIREQFEGGIKLRYIVTNGIGANAQFMWSEVEMYNLNKPADAPTWYHVVTARDLENLPMEMTPENTLLVHLSRSGSTLEGVDVANRLLQEGFNKMIVLANGGALGSIVKRVPNTSMQIGMQVHIGGRNMHRKTPLYEAVQTIAGMFLPAMDSPNFARYHDEFDQANDLGSENSLPVNAARFLYTLMRTQKIEHIATMTNTKQLALIASEGNQFFMEGANGEHIISWGDHDLTTEPDFVLENLAASPAGEITMGIALLDKASPTYEAEARRVDEVAKRMPLIRFTIDSREFGMDGISLQHQAGFDMFWTDFVSALTTFLRVDNNANPNVADVRQRTASYASRWSERAQRYADDDLGTGKATMLVSYGHPATSKATAAEEEALGTVEKQKPAKTTDDMKELARTMVEDLAQKGMLQGRNRLNIFAGTYKLFSLMQRLRNNTYRTPLSMREGWIIETGYYPNRAHTGHEATLAHSEDPVHPLLADRTINVFFNSRKLGDSSWFHHIFQNVTGDGRFDSLNGANIDQLTDAMTFPNAEAAAKFSPTVMLEFDHRTEDTDQLLEAFYTAFVEELDKALEQLSQTAVTENTDIQSSELSQQDAEPTIDTDQAFLTNVGGIDLNPKLLDLQIKRDGKGVPLPLVQQPIGTMKIEGFLPIIINVTPVNLPLLLGATDGKDPFKSAQGKESADQLSFLMTDRKYWLLKLGIHAPLKYLLTSIYGWGYTEPVPNEFSSRKTSSNSKK